VKSKIVTLAIDKLAGLGDGMGVHEGRKTYVPYTFTGDVVAARLVRKTTDADYGVLDAIVTRSPGRVTPVCKHFGVCGGCALQHVNAADYSAFKQTMAAEAVRKAGFEPGLTQPIISLPAASRRRVELKVSDGKLGYFEERSHKLVNITECKVLEPELEALVMNLKRQLFTLADVTGVQINGVDGGWDVVIDQAEKREYKIGEMSGILRLSLRYNSAIRTLYQAAPVTLKLGDVTVAVPAGAFLQATREAQVRMTQLVSDSVAGAAHVLDLFAGIGTYSFPLSINAQVTAVEGESFMVEAMRKAAADAGLGKRFNAEICDLFYKPLPVEKLKHYDAIVINPPRAGAAAQIKEIAASGVKKVTMVSCNPATFTRDARTLKDAGYALTRLTPIDQFVYSSHLELVAEFDRG
jgi:23S rRNA (uracil1939-C5)-methyltransferase